MASLVFARRFSSNLCKCSSSSSPLSYLTHTRDRFTVPKMSNSFSSIFNRHCNSTVQYSKSPADSFSMEKLRFEYSLDTSFSLLLMGYSIYWYGELDIWFGLYFVSYYVAKVMETKSIEKVVLLLNLHEQGKIPIQNAVLQLIKEVNESNLRRNAVFSVYGSILCVKLFQILIGIIF